MADEFTIEDAMKLARAKWGPRGYAYRRPDGTYRIVGMIDGLQQEWADRTARGVAEQAGLVEREVAR